MIQIENLSVSSILKPINTIIDQHTLLIGPSGSGKTTLLKAMVGLLPFEGKLTVDGNEVGSLIGPKRNFSMVWQDSRLLPNLTVKENLEIVGHNYGELLNTFQLEKLLYRLPHQISGGEAQRVNIVRGLISPCRYVLLDEPMQGIDPVVVRKLIKNIVHYLNKHNKIGVMVTHEIYHAYGFFEEVRVIRNGTLHAEGRFESLYNEPSSPWLANFFGPYIVLDSEDLRYFDLHSNENPCMVRPEWFKIKKLPNRRDHAANAVVVSVAWHGSSYKVNCSLIGTNKPITVEVYTDLVVQPGENVYVNFKKCSRPAWVLDR